MANAFNLSSSTPPAPAGAQLVTFQADASSVPNISAYVPMSAVSSVADRTGAVTLTFGDLSGIVSLAQGGTGAATAAAALTALGGAAKGANSDITSLAGLTTALSVAQGGTGAGTAAAALTALGGAARGANSDITSLAGLTTALSVAQGGTGAGTAAAALTALGGAAKGANNDITSLAGLTSPLSVAQGGTGAATAAAALAALGGASLTAANTFAGAQTFSNPANLTFGSNWQNYTPTVLGTGSMSVSNLGINVCNYLRIGPFVMYQVSLAMTLGGSASGSVTVSLPLTVVGYGTLFFASYLGPGVAAQTLCACFFSNATTLALQLNGGGAFPLGNYTFNFFGAYRVT